MQYIIYCLFSLLNLLCSSNFKVFGLQGIKQMSLLQYQETTSDKYTNNIAFNPSPTGVYCDVEISFHGSSLRVQDAFTFNISMRELSVIS